MQKALPFFIYNCCTTFKTNNPFCTNTYLYNYKTNIN